MSKARLAMVLCGPGDGRRLAEVFRRILADDPGSILAFAERAGALRTQGRVEEAEELVASSLTIDREYLPLLVQRGNNQLTRKDWKMGAEDLGGGL